MLKIFKKNSSIILPIRALRCSMEIIYQKENICTKKMTNLIVCSDYYIRKLNRSYRNIDKVTDVLSFPFNEEDFLGEIYISSNRTEIQARRYGVSFKNEFIRLTIHGLLHLIGYNHVKKQERNIMEEREEFYLSLLMI